MRWATTGSPLGTRPFSIKITIYNQKSLSVKISRGIFDCDYITTLWRVPTIRKYRFTHKGLFFAD